ncbi:lyase family protein [Nocardia takedensis]|uniref:lyase family protein n=1 Tax=Nocardia takedensis TaxID=259390 RepID=UPI000594399D|nr:lyase family protein [Nocardia takedensis]
MPTSVEIPSADTGLLAPVRAGARVAALLDDAAWVRAMVEVEIALAGAQAALGIVPADVPDRIAEALARHDFDVAALAVAARGAANPVVAFVAELTRVVAAHDPVAADHVHRGSTSQDILDTAAMLVAARVLAEVHADLTGLADLLAALVRRHRDTPVVARTLAMHAVPTTFGAKAAGWLDGVLDACDRVRPLATGALPVQLGGAAGTSAAYLEAASSQGRVADAAALYADLAAEFARRLSLRAPAVPWQANRTPLADIAGVLAQVAGVLGKIAADVIASARTEVAELAEPAAAGRGESSAMPQKRNPALSALLRSTATQVPALVSILHTAMVGEDERSAGAWHAEWQPLRDALLLVGGAAATAVELCDGLVVDDARMRTNLALSGGQILTERLAVLLAPLLGRLETKTLLREAAHLSGASGRPLADILAEEPSVRAHLSPEAIAAALTPENYLGAAPIVADSVLARYRRMTGGAPE